MTKKVLGNLSEGLAFVISAPAGTGKTTLAEMLKKEFPCVVESVSYTTRKPREGETDGRDYFFISEKEFIAKIEAGEFLEYAQVFDNYYGTSRKYVENERKKGHHVILVIDTQGAISIKTKLDAVFIFISPPSRDELERRLRMRKTETEEAVQKRLSWADKEIQMVSYYDYHIVNFDLKIAYDALRSILVAEEHKTKYNP
jgi:guanylate kinase